MNGEYQRLDAEASAVELQLRNLGMAADLGSAADLANFEQELADLGRKLASLRLGQALIRATNSSEMRTQERQRIYNDRAFNELSAIANLLEEAGCNNSDILDHCRDQGRHACGCWVVDLLLRQK